ncbi:MAG: Nif11-like leader peptide family natural product precursor [Rikenellaceae bacterium]
MSIQLAIDFLARVQGDDDFRKGCYKYRSREELLKHLQQEGYSFSEEEFENAINHLLLRCSEESQATEVYHLQSWFNLFAPQQV